MTNIADTLQKIDRIASQCGQTDDPTRPFNNAPNQLNGGAPMTMKASPLGSATLRMAKKRRPELVD